MSLYNHLHPYPSFSHYHLPLFVSVLTAPRKRKLSGRWGWFLWIAAGKEYAGEWWAESAWKSKIKLKEMEKFFNSLKLIFMSFFVKCLSWHMMDKSRTQEECHWRSESIMLTACTVKWTREETIWLHVTTVNTFIKDICILSKLFWLRFCWAIKRS